MGTMNDIAILAIVNVGEKENENVEEYQQLERGIGRVWKLKRAEVALLEVRQNI